MDEKEQKKSEKIMKMFLERSITEVKERERDRQRREAIEKVEREEQAKREKLAKEITNKNQNKNSTNQCSIS